ncbi:MAG: CBS domain-containing protein [Candidatus Saccharibacteria bacterium]|nr:CBS domain-containing protein [Candidatus Saccharibacteria bacterium]
MKKIGEKLRDFYHKAFVEDFDEASQDNYSRAKRRAQIADENYRNLDTESSGNGESEEAYLITSRPAEPFTPKTLREFLELIKRTPLEVLSVEDRATLASALSFHDRTVGSIMLPKSKITFVGVEEFMGPLTLDRLYKSGQTHFPVTSEDKKQLVGIIHTSALNSLDIKSAENDRAEKYVDPTIYYLRDDYTLEQAMAAFLRTNSFIYIVIDKTGKIVGLLTYQMIVINLLGYKPVDKFDEDTSILAVMKRGQGAHIANSGENIGAHD